jgi:hypothetical protein
MYILGDIDKAVGKNEQTSKIPGPLEKSER